MCGLDCIGSVIGKKVGGFMFQSSSHRSTRLAVGWLLATSAVTIALPAYAQSEPAKSEILSQDGTADDQEIVVSARKRVETLTEVPIAISVIQGGDLEARGTARVKDAQAFIPNVALSDAGNSNSNTNIVIRGISTNARNVGFESGVSVYVDGVFTGRPSSFNQDFVDIERLEVLRGPQGTLFGKNTIAGAINITTTKPNYDFGGRVAAEYGSFDLMSGQAVLNLPIVADKAALRISGFGRKRDGLVRNIPNGERFNDEGSWGGRMQLRFQPNDKLTIDLGADYLDESRRQSFPETLDDPAAPGPRTTVNDFIPLETRKLWGLNGTVALELGDHVLTSITAYRENDASAENDNDNTAGDVLVADFTDSQKQFTQEIRLVSPGGERFDYVLGAFYFWQDSSADHIGIFGRDFPFTGGTRVAINSLGSVETTSLAAYADAQFRLTDSLLLLGGLRYTHEEKKLAYRQTGQLLPGIIFQPIPLLTDKLSDNDVSPQVGISFQPRPTLNIYGRVSWGYKSGGWNADFIGSSLIAAAVSNPAGDGRFDAADIDFAPEQATNYEFGIKGQWLDRKLRANLAAFYTDYRNLQISQFLGVLNGGTVITNAGKAKIKGVELEFELRPSDRFGFSGSFGYLDATFADYANCEPGIPSCDGRRLPNAPKFSYAVGLDYRVPLSGELGLHFRTEMTGVSSSFTTAANVNRLSIGDYTLVNASLALTDNDSGWNITAYVRNLFDKDYLTGAVNDDLLGTGRTFGGYGAPRTFGVRASFNF
jgi:iron complex outermembrane recepter protein